MKLFHLFSLGLIGFILTTMPALSNEASAPKVVVSVKPLHSLVAGVMKGVGEPRLLLRGNSSPHHFQLKPSDARSLQQADLLVWVGPSLETPLKSIVKNYGMDAASLELIKIPDLKLLHMRTAHDHGDEDHDDEHHEEGHDDVHHEAGHHDHHEEGEHETEDHETDHHKTGHHDDNDNHEDHAAEGHEDHLNLIDPHIWLSIDNAIAITKSVTARLSKISPSHKEKFEKNADLQIKGLIALKASLAAKMKPLKAQGYMVFHDAFHYFTEPYGLHFEGALSLNPTVQPSAKHLRELRSRLAKGDVACIFAEPQFSAKMIQALIRGTKVKTALLDPIGVDIKAGPGAYETMIKRLGQNLATCMKPIS